MKSESALVRTDSGIELYPVSSMYLYETLLYTDMLEFKRLREEHLQEEYS